MPRSIGAGLIEAVDRLVADSVRLGYHRARSEHAFWPLVGRVLLAAGHPDPSRLGPADLAAYAGALDDFANRADCLLTTVRLLRSGAGGHLDQSSAPPEGGA